MIRNLIMKLWVVIICLFRFRVEKKKKKLLVLDLNGILVDFVDNPPKDYKADIKIKRKSAFKRPFCDDFLEFCFANFEVGVWSSRKKKNMDGLVDFLLGDMKHQVLFYWDQSQCTEPGLRVGQIGIKTNEKKQKPLFLKELKKIWTTHDANLPWKNGEYNESNTLLLDDSPYKSMFNPPHTAVFPTSYTFQTENDNSLGPGGDVRVYLEGLAVAENVQMYVEQHPFGQAPIDQASSLYHRVLSIIENTDRTDRREIWSNKSQKALPNIETKYESTRHNSTSFTQLEKGKHKNLPRKKESKPRRSLVENQAHDSGMKPSPSHTCTEVGSSEVIRGRGRRRGNIRFDPVRRLEGSQKQSLTHMIPDKDTSYISHPNMP